MKNGDLIKESWRFHGFRAEGNIFNFSSVTEVKSKDICYRLLIYDDTITYDINRVNRQGWPVSEYKIEQITPEQEQVLKLNEYDNYYKCYRETIYPEFADIEESN